MPINANLLYRTLFQRNSVYLTGILGAGFAFSISYDLATSAYFDWWNQGKQWKDIRHKYVEAADE